MCGGSGILVGKCNCGGDVVDACGVCGGDGSSCAGCDSVANSGKVVDLCGVCDGGGIASGTCNCNGDVLDQCGVCGGDGSGCDTQVTEPTIVYINKTVEKVVEVEVQVPWYTYRLSQLEATWGSLEFAHCELNFTLSELRNRFKASLPPNFKTGGLGPLMQAGVFEVWVCIENHYCSNHPVDKVTLLSYCEFLALLL